MTRPFVTIVTGSDSDLPFMAASLEVLRSFSGAFEAPITAAHRSSGVTWEYVRVAEPVAARAAALQDSLEG